MINLILYLLVMAGLIYTGILYASTALILMAFTGLLFAVLAYLFLAVQMFYFSCDFTVPISMIEIGEAAEAVLKLNNRGIFPILKVRFLLEWKQPLSGKRGRKKIKRNDIIPGKGEIESCLLLEGTCCGNYEYHMKSIRLYDLTGIFYLKKKYRKEADFCVMPKIYRAAVQVTEASRHFAGDAEQNGGVISPDGSDMIGMRPFRNGDQIQRIHWKMSAKQGEMIVKEYGGMPGCAVLILLDIGEMKKRMDELVTLVSSLSFSLAKEKCVHYIAWFGKKEMDIVRFRVENEESLYLFLLLFYGEGTESYRGDLKTLYWEKYRGESVVTELLINKELELYQGDLLLFTLSHDHLEKEIEEVEFVV